MKNSNTPTRRHLLAGMASLAALSAPAQATSSATASAKTGDLVGNTLHKIVFQLNKADYAYQEAIFNSISAVLKKYVDDVSIVVVVWGPGIHLLAKKPKRPVPKLLQDRARSMAEAYGIRFIACGNTMHSVGWSPSDMFDFVQVEDVGAAAVMELQEKGYAYVAW